MTLHQESPFLRSSFPATKRIISIKETAIHISPQKMMINKVNRDGGQGKNIQLAQNATGQNNLEAMEKALQTWSFISLALSLANVLTSSLLVGSIVAHVIVSWISPITIMIIGAAALTMSSVVIGWRCRVAARKLTKAKECATANQEEAAL